jgi:membrane fusion protein (multidrug efflux system)
MTPMTKVRIPILLLLACACSRANPEAAGTALKLVKAPPVHVDTLAVAERDVPQTLLLAGSLRANQESDLAANASGRVTRTMVERGSYVAKQATIAQLDTRMAALATNEAQANAETAQNQKTLAEEECQRYQRLFQRGVITQQEYDRQTSSCKTAATSAVAAQSREEQARQQLGDATIRAPFPGLVAERYVSVGEYVHPDTKVAHIVDIDPLRLELTIPEANMSAVKEGQTVVFEVAAFPGRAFTGTVHYIGPAVRAQTRDLVFEAIVPNKDHRLRPGLFATARLDVGTRKLPVVPKDALRSDGTTLRGFVVAGNHLEERIVQSGVEVPGGISIVDGLKSGEKLVAKPADSLTDGQAVE